MNTVNEQFSDLNKNAVDAAMKFANLSVEGVERFFALQMATTKSTLSDAAKNAAAVASVKDVQELNALRTKLAEASLAQATNYSRTVYEMATSTQAEISSLFEERVASIQQNIAAGLDKVAKTAPAGSDVAVAALKSNLAAATAAFDSLTKAAKNASTYADAGYQAATDFGTKASAAPKAAAKKKATSKRKK